MAYFVTGATGFIGRRLVEQLLDKRQGKVYLLVRESSADRLDDLIERWTAVAGASVRKRVVPVIGDLRRPLLGVEQERVEELRGKIEHFFHLAAVYDMTAPAEQNTAVNVGGTTHAVELARAVEAGRLHHVSSIAVAGTYKGGRECTHKGGAISNCRTDNFPQTGQFVDELFALKRTSVDAIRHEDDAGKPLSVGADVIYDFKRSDRSLKVKPRGCAWHNDKIGDSNRGTESPRIGRCVDNHIIVACSDPAEFANPVRGGLIGIGDLVDGELQVTGFCPLAGRSLGISVDQSYHFSKSVQFRRNGNRQGGLAHTTFALR